MVVRTAARDSDALSSSVRKLTAVAAAWPRSLSLLDEAGGWQLCSVHINRKFVISSQDLRIQRVARGPGVKSNNTWERQALSVGVNRLVVVKAAAQNGL